MQTRFSDIYFSGSQCQILINNKVISEAVGVEGVLQVEQIPFYGYASRHIDAVGKGRVIAMGSLTINYIFDGYLLAHINQAYNTAKTDKSSDKSKNTGTALVDNAPIITDKSDDYYKDIKGFEQLENDIYMPSDEVISGYKDKFWNNQSDSFKFQNDKVRPEFEGPFNIQIRDFHVGEMKHPDPKGKTTNYQEKTLIDVFLNKYSTIRRTDAGQTLESYSFICRTFI